MCIEPEMPAITNSCQKESDMLWDYFCWAPTLPCSPIMAMDELLSLTLQEEEYKFIDVKATSFGRFSSKAMPHFSSFPRDTGTAWQMLILSHASATSHTEFRSILGTQAAFLSGLEPSVEGQTLGWIQQRPY